LDIDPGGIVVIFAKKQEKKLSPKKIIKKKEKNLMAGQKYEIKNEVFHVYALNKILSCTKFTRSIHTHVLIDC
jgi:hypothetical protein